MKFIVRQEWGYFLTELQWYWPTCSGNKKILFLRFLGIKSQASFAKYHSVYENRDLFYAEFCGTVINSFFIIKQIYLDSGGLINNLGFIWPKKTHKAVNPEPRT